MRWVPEDGTPVTQPGSFVDEGLDGARCAWLDRLEGPEARCYPGGFLQLSPLYEDASCAQAVVPGDLCEDARPYVFGERIRGAAAEDDVYRAYRSTGESVTAASLFYIEQVPALPTTGMCGPLSDSVRGAFYPWAEGSLVRAERIQEADLVPVVEEVLTDLGGGLVDVLRRWGDGTVERYRRADCGARLDAEGVLRCLGSSDDADGPGLERRAVGRGRLRPVRLLDREGRAWPVSASDRAVNPFLCCAVEGVFPTYRDTRFGFDCVPERTVEGVRCLPLTTISLRPVTFGRRYLDPACTEQVAVAWGPTARRATHAARRRVTTEPCEGRAPVDTLEARDRRLPPGTALFSELGESGCQPAGRVPGDANELIAWRLQGVSEDLTRYARFRESPLD